MKLPNELLSYIAVCALRSPRLDEKTDELFIQPKSKIAFTSLCNGFGAANRLFRSILLREWFRVLHIQDIQDLEDITNDAHGRIKSISVSCFVRELYFHQPVPVAERHFKALSNIHTISFPVDCPSSATPLPAAFIRHQISFLPVSLLSLELRELVKCSPSDLEAFGVGQFTKLRELRVTCYPSAWPALLDPTDESKSITNRDLKQIAEQYIRVLAPLRRLRTLSLDMHFADTQLFPDRHLPPTAAVVLPPQGPGLVLAPTLVNVNQPANPAPIPAPAGNAEGVPCTGDRSCSSCWAVREHGSEVRETAMAKWLAQHSPCLRIVEWTIWYVEKGKGERRRRIKIDRDYGGGNEGACAHTARQPTVGTPVTNRDSSSPQDGTEVEVTLPEDITCITSIAPLTVYPAIII